MTLTPAWRMFNNSGPKAWNGLLEPVWPRPSAARSTAWIEPCCTAMKPLQIPLVNSPDNGGVTGTGGVEKRRRLGTCVAAEGMGEEDPDQSKGSPKKLSVSK